MPDFLSGEGKSRFVFVDRIVQDGIGINHPRSSR
jgi:hypothetical protein